MKKIKLKKICISIFIVIAIVNVINIYGNNIYANTVSEVENNIDEESGNCPIYYSKKNKSSDEKTSLVTKANTTAIIGGNKERAPTDTGSMITPNSK